MMKRSKTTLIGISLAAMLASSPMASAEVLFDNGSAMNNVGSLGGSGYSTNDMTNWKVYDNFSFAVDGSIELVWFQMAVGGGADFPYMEPFVFSVYEDNAGEPGAEIFSTTLNAGDYSTANFRAYLNGTPMPDMGYDFSFELDGPLTLAPGNYWVSFWGIEDNLFYTLGTGSGDGFYHESEITSVLSLRQGNTAFRLEGELLDGLLAAVDIRPGSDSNPINPRSNGVIPVAVLGSADFDATQIDGATVVFGPNDATPTHRNGGHVEDVNGDGFMDMVFHFRTQQTGIECGDTDAVLSGETFVGEAFSGMDSFTTVGCGNNGDDDVDDVDGSNDDADGDDAGGNGGTDAGAANWTLLLALGIIGLLGFQRRRLSNR